jgi:hypothetical protein
MWGQPPSAVRRPRFVGPQFGTTASTTSSGIVTLSCVGDGDLACAASIQDMHIPDNR